MTETYKTGAKASPRHVLASARPYRATAAAPSQWIRLPKTLSYWLNDVDGICVTAEESFNKACSGILISDAETKRWAQAHGVLNGAYLNEVLDWMTQAGFSQDGNLYNDGGKSSVDWTNQALLSNAIYNGPVKTGVAAQQLQQAVNGNNGLSGWFGIGFRPDPNLDHCISLCGYGPVGQLAKWISDWYGVQVRLPQAVDPSSFGVSGFTWKSVGIFDVASMVNVTGEAWYRTPNTIIQGSGAPTQDQVFMPTVGPTPVPTPTPIPTPVPTPIPTGVVAAVDQAFRIIERQFARVPGAVNLLRQANAFVDAYLRAAGYHAELAAASGTIPPSVLQIVDAAFTAAMAAYPAYALLIGLVKGLVDQYLPAV